MPLVKITDATVEPVTLAQAKRHLRETLVDADNDADILALVTAARTAAEDRLGRTLMETTWRLVLDRFDDVILLERPPIIAVEAVRYVDTDGLLQTLPTTGYQVDRYSEPGRLIPAFARSWPRPRCQTGAVEIDFRAGYDSATKVPSPIVAWIKLALTDLYEQRARSSEKPVVPNGFTDGLLDTYVMRRP